MRHYGKKYGTMAKTIEILYTMEKHYDNMGKITMVIYQKLVNIDLLLENYGTIVLWKTLRHSSKL